MSPERCLEWCKEHGTTMRDRTTLRHVVDWLANSASTVARTPEDTAAITAAFIHATKELANPEKPK